ncbi:MAG: xylose isomerase, partial [Kineosporiaceae bacterium]
MDPDARFAPTPQDRFSFGMWTVNWPARDPFGEPTRALMDPVHIVERLAALGAWGITFHDDDLVPFGSSDADRDAAIARFRAVLDRTGMVVPMVTTNLFTHPVFKDGAFTANDRDVRRYALAKAARQLDLGAELGARTFVLWGGREGAESMAAKDVRVALDRYKEAVDLLCAYVTDSGYDMRLAIEPKPNEPRGDILLPTIGHAIAFIQELDRPDLVGLNPEVGHEQMAGLNFVHGVAQALWQGKLFHIDLNAQRIGRYDQDFRFGAQDLMEAFLLVGLLEESGYDGPRHFDARPYRVERGRGVWEFATGCMRSYLALADKASRMREDAEIRAALEAAGTPGLAEPTVGPYSRAAADTLLATRFDPDALGERG